MVKAIVIMSEDEQKQLVQGVQRTSGENRPSNYDSTKSKIMFSTTERQKYTVYLFYPHSFSHTVPCVA